MAAGEKTNIYKEIFDKQQEITKIKAKAEAEMKALKEGYEVQMAEIQNTAAAEILIIEKGLKPLIEKA